MGWNSSNHFRLNINDAIIRAQAQAMAPCIGTERFC